MKTKPCHHCSGSGKETDQIALGAEQRAKRKKAGLSLRQLAKLMCFTTPYVCDLELGRRRWSQKLLDKYEEALDGGKIND